MKEAYVSFEVAKLLKEKGFDWDCTSHFDSNHIECPNTPMNFNSTKYWVSRPTHQLACAWLREVHDLYIEVVRGYDHFFVSINKMHPLREYSMKNDTFDDYDDAIEAALKYTLENLILEWARQVMNGETGFIRKEVEEVFPELKESEDERIRQNCIHFLELQKSHHAATFEIEECIAWLEKQARSTTITIPEDLKGTDTDGGVKGEKGKKGEV